MNIEEILKKEINNLKQNNIENSTLKAKILLANILNVKKEYLLIHSEEEIKQEDKIKYENCIKELIKGKPLQYITNKQEFMGLDFYVDENVLIPQPDTEILVEKAIEISKTTQKNKILDMCTGSGCIAISLAKKINNAQITAVDISNSALNVANKNAINNNVENKIKFINSDMFNNIEEKFDIIVSNPPYIETETINKLGIEVQNEPHLALDGGIDGLKFYKTIANNAFKYLNENGYLLLEIGYNQQNSVTQLLQDIGKYKNIETVKDLGGNYRIVIARKE
jgi:release factor glutamine methyltransferase